jgi:hypothetical protein
VEVEEHKLACWICLGSCAREVIKWGKMEMVRLRLKKALCVYERICEKGNNFFEETTSDGYRTAQNSKRVVRA